MTEENISTGLNTRVQFLILFGLVFLSALIVRLPHLISNGSFFDGDEAVIGIMAQNLLNGKIDVYFLGQNYGLSLLESASVSFFLKILGVGVWALRLGGLFIFSLGCTFIIRVFQKNNSPGKMVLFIGLLLILFPSWYLWGMMVRGGYVTSFLLVSILFYITQTKQQTILWCILVGGIAALTFESHLLVLFTFFPILIAWVFKSGQKLRSMIITGISALSTIFTLRLFYIENPVWSKPKLNTGVQEQWDQLLYHLGDLLSGFSNYHYFTAGFKLELWLNIVVLGGLILFLVILLILLKKVQIRSEKVMVLLYVPVIIGYIFLMSMMGQPAPRYWLGLFTGLLFLMIYLILYTPEMKLSLIHYAMLTFFIVLAFAGDNHRRDWYQTDKNEMVLLSKLHNTVTSNEVDVLYTVEPDFQWKWNYMYGDKIPAMHVNERERTMQFVDRINELKHNPVVKIGVVGFNKIYNGLNIYPEFYEQIIVVDGKYFLFLNPSEIEFESFKAFYK